MIVGIDDTVDSPKPHIAEHALRYAGSGGQDGYWWNGLPTLLLTTTGRRTGRPRRTPLVFGRDGDDLVVVASYRGRAVHPLWYENLLVHPGVVVQIRDDVFAARAEPVTDPGQRRRLWTLMVELHPTYAEYQAATSREIPVIRLARC